MKEFKYPVTGIGTEILYVPNVAISHDEDDLISRLRDVKLSQSETKPYEDSKIELREYYPEDLYSGQLYVLEENLDRIHALSHMMSEHFDQDIFNLDGWLELNYEQGQQQAILPPVVEYTIGGQAIVCDGTHRVYLALITNRPIICAVIYDPKVAYYSHPVKWQYVTRVAELNNSVRKKFHVCSDYRKLYRDFNTAFPYVGAPRPVRGVQ